MALFNLILPSMFCPGFGLFDRYQVSHSLLLVFWDFGCVLGDRLFFAQLNCFSQGLFQFEFQEPLWPISAHILLQITNYYLRRHDIQRIQLFYLLFHSIIQLFDYSISVNNAHPAMIHLAGGSLVFNCATKIKVGPLCLLA